MNIAVFYDPAGIAVGVGTTLLYGRKAEILPCRSELAKMREQTMPTLSMLTPRPHGEGATNSKDNIASIKFDVNKKIFALQFLLN